MESWFQSSRAALTQAAAATLRDYAAHNRSGLPPFQLPQVAQQVIAGLLDYAAGEGADGVAALSDKMARRGLGLMSVLELGRKVVQTAQEHHATGEQVVVIHDYLSVFIGSLVAAENRELSKQRDDMQAALERARQSHEQDLLRIIQDLSTPIMPVHDGILVVPLVGDIDRDRADKITERLLGAIVTQRARFAIIDITGVPRMDKDVAAGLLSAAQAARLLGTGVLLVGIRSEIAQTMVRLGIDVVGLVTLANLQKGIEYALRQQGLAIDRAVSAKRAISA